MAGGAEGEDPISGLRFIEQVHTFLKDPFVRSSLQKWGMLGTSRVWVLRRFGPLHKAQGAELAQQVFSDPQVLQELKAAAGLSSEPGAPTDIDTEPVPCSLTRMDVFDKLAEAEPPIVRESGDVVHCFDDYRDGIQISDMLRSVLLNPDSEHAELFTENERAEFLFRIFHHLCVGGGCCQFEDNVEPYLDVTKKIYKDLLSVQKNEGSGKIEVAAAVHKVNNITFDNGLQLFPKPSPHSFCYLIIDPVRQLCKVWYCPYASWW